MSITFTRNLFMYMGRGALVAALAFAAGCGDDGDDGNNNTPDAGTESDAGPTGPNSLERSMTFIGGDSGLQSVEGYTYQAEGTRYIVNEGPVPGEAVQSGTFTATVSYDLGASTAADDDNLRIDYMRAIRALVNLDLTYSEIFTADGGYIIGDDSLFADLPNAPMLSSRWASGLKQQLLLNPHVFLRAVAEDPSLATVSADATVDGTTYGVFEVNDPISPIRCYVAEDGSIAMIKTLANDFLERDIEITVTYSDWQAVGGFQFPGTVELTYGDDLIHTETRTLIEANPTFDADLFTFPEGAPAPTFDQTLATRGETTLQFYQSLSAIGIPLDFSADNVVLEEIGDGIWFVGGASHNSMVVEQANGLVVVEAPNYPERADNILAMLATQFPDKSVTHVIATHHHEDHSAGLRSFVAAGATIVVHEVAQAFFEEVFSSPSTIVPDTLSADTDAEAVIEVVTADTPFVIEDADRPVEVHNLPTGHANDMVLITAGANGEFVFESDLYNPGNGGVSLNPTYAFDLAAAIEASAPNATTIVGGHGVSAPLQELLTYVAGLPQP